jgi:hypothetical protein
MNYCYYVCMLCLLCEDVTVSKNDNYQYLKYKSSQFDNLCIGCVYDTLNDKSSCVQTLYNHVLYFPESYPLTGSTKMEDVFGYPFYLEYNFLEIQCYYPTPPTLLDDEFK